MCLVSWVVCLVSWVVSWELLLQVMGILDSSVMVFWVLALQTPPMMVLVLALAAAQSFGLPSALLIHVWLPYLWPFGPLCSMALCSCGFQVTSSMVGVGLGAGVVGDVGAFCRRRAGCGAAAGIICFHGFHVDG